MKRYRMQNNCVIDTVCIRKEEKDTCEYMPVCAQNVTMHRKLLPGVASVRTTGSMRVRGGREAGIFFHF